MHKYETTYGSDAVDMGYRNASHRATCEEIVAEMECIDESNKQAQFIAAVGVLCSILILAAFAGIGGL